MNTAYAPLDIARALAAGVPCRTCGGTGLHAVTDCVDCNGTGKRVCHVPCTMFVDLDGRHLIPDMKITVEEYDEIISVYGWYPAPVLLTNDGGGWLPWLAGALGMRYWRSGDGYWSAGTDRGRWATEDCHADTPLALGEAMLRRAGLLSEEVTA